MADRIDMYLKWNNQDEYYVNTSRENELVNKFQALYSITKSAQDTCEECSTANLDKWRRAYLGTLGALRKDDGKESSNKGRQLRKMIYEIIESLVDNSVPMPKMKPRYKSDLPLVSITENYLKFEVDDILTKYENDRSERATYTDGTGWYKVWWDSLSNTHERSGDVRIEFCPVDQIYPQPGVKDYKKLEYIFELRQVSTTRIYDLYGRNIIPNQGDTNLVDVVSCYYLNEDRIVGLFMWSPTSLQVICNEKDWQIRKVRKCKTCGNIVPTGDICPRCGGKSFKYHNAETEILEEDLMEVYNPYEAGETDDPAQQDELSQRVFLKAGTEVPFYRIGQLPFVPRPAVSHVNSIYGISISGMLLDMQDMINKIYTKMADKTLKSGAVVTQFEKGRPIDDTNETFKVLKVKTVEEAGMVTVKQVVADTSQDMVVASTIYESGKASSGVTNSFQGQKDSSAASGKAKEYQALQTAGRIESLRVMKAAAFAGVYELVLKYLLAFSDESRKFVKVLPNGEQLEQSWAGPDYDTLVEEKSNINILTDGVYANVTFGTNYLNLSAQGAKATYIVSGNYDGYYTLSMKVTSASTRVLQVIVNGETYTTNTKKSTSQKELALTVKMKKGANVITFAAYGAQAAPSLYGFTLTRNSALAELSDTSVTVKAEDFDSSTSTLTGTVTSTDVPAQTLLDSSVNFNSYTIYKVTVPEDGIYMFTVRYICMDENIQTRIFRVTVDGSRELALVAPLTQSSTSVADAESVVSIFSQPLTAGEHTFKIGGGGSYFNSTASPSPNLVSFSLTLVTPAEAE